VTARIVRCSAPMTTVQARMLRASSAPGAAIVVSPGLALHTASGAAAAVLDALGITGAQRKESRVHESALDQVLPWLLAYRVRELAVHRADLLVPPALELLVEITAAAGVRLWLTGTQMGGPAEAVLATQRITRLDAQPFLDRWLAAAAAVADNRLPERHTPAGWPPMPADDFPTFRAAARRVLDADTFAAVDRLYLETLWDARGRLAPLLAGESPDVPAGQPLPSGRALLDRSALEEAVTRLLHAAVHQSTNVSEAIVRIRATQSAAFGLGWLLGVSPPRLIATMSEPARAAREAGSTWAALRTIRWPDLAAVCVLAALDLDMETMLTLRRCDVADDGSCVTVAGVTLPVPTAAHVLLQAQHIAGDLAGFGPDAVFLHLEGQPLKPARLLLAVRQAAYLDNGVLLLSRKLDRSWSSHMWIHRWGVTLQDIA